MVPLSYHPPRALFVGSAITFNKTGGPADITALDTQMESDINDQENSKSDADCVKNVCKILKQILKRIASWHMLIT